MTSEEREIPDLAEAVQHLEETLVRAYLKLSAGRVDQVQTPATIRILRDECATLGHALAKVRGRLMVEDMGLSSATR